MKQWYAVCTKPSAEKKVAAAILKKGIQTYLPLALSHKRWQHGLGAGATPLFPSLVFVRTAEEEGAAVVQTPGVVNFYYWLSKPVVIREMEVEMIRRFLLGHKQPTVEKIKVDTTGIARLISGTPATEGSPAAAQPLAVKLVLPSMGYCLMAEPETAAAQPVEGEAGYRTDTPGTLALG